MTGFRDESIAAVGANPAWQKVLTFEKLYPGRVNRARECRQLAAGKGVNLARAAATWGTRCGVFQLAGGLPGELLTKYLDAEGVPHLTITTDAPTRECVTCLCLATGTATELIAPPGVIAPREAATFQEAVLASLSTLKGIALCGTLPPGIASEFYAAVATARPSGSLLLADAWKDIGPALEVGVDILKINTEELDELFPGLTPVEAARRCLATKRVGMVALTAGAGNAFLFHKKEAWRFTIPPLDTIVNPIGAGDTVSGVFLSELVAGAPPQFAFRSALAAGSASCLTVAPASFELAFSRSLVDTILIEQLS